MLRFNTALRMREEVEGAATAGLKGQAYEGGGGGGSGRQPSDYAIDCMRMVNKVQESMHPDLYRLLIWVAVDDFWAWEWARDREGTAPCSPEVAQGDRHRGSRVRLSHEGRVPQALGRLQPALGASAEAGSVPSTCSCAAFRFR